MERGKEQMQRSKYVRIVHDLLADNEGKEDETHQHEQGKEPDKVVYLYPLEGGGIVMTETPIEDEPEAPIVESGKLQTDQRPLPRKDSPYFLYFILILCLFLVLDVADNTFIALMTPTVNVTLTPSVKTITLNGTAQLGKVLSPIALSESQTVPTTGKGHQDAARATGSLTFYNGLSTVQSVAAGTTFTGQDGIQVATDATVTIAANNPPNDGEAQVSAHAVNVGSNGNIQAEDINTTLSAGLFVKNLAPFSNGQDERNFSIVTKSDRDSAAATLKARVSSSMTAALQGQLMPGEQLQRTPCIPTVTADHAIGDEAATLQVTVSDSCTAIAYNAQDLTAQATHLLTTQATKKIGSGYMLQGNVQVSVTKATATINKTVVLLAFTTQGTYVYQLTTKAQQDIKTLIAGKPRLTALHQLATLPGVSHVSISGVPDDQLMPDDVTHIHILIILTGF